MRVWATSIAGIELADNDEGDGTVTEGATMSACTSGIRVSDIVTVIVRAHLLAFRRARPFVGVDVSGKLILSVGMVPAEDCQAGSP